MSIIIKGLDMPRKKGEYLRIEIQKDGLIWLDNGDEWELMGESAVEVVECKDCKWLDSCKALDIYLDGFCSKGERRDDMGEPTYHVQLTILAMSLASPIEYREKEHLIKSFCKKFDKTEDEVLRDLKGGMK